MSVRHISERFYKTANTYKNKLCNIDKFIQLAVGITSESSPWRQPSLLKFLRRGPSPGKSHLADHIFYLITSVVGAGVITRISTIPKNFYHTTVDYKLFNKTHNKPVSSFYAPAGWPGTQNFLHEKTAVIS
jgi:hypothetical protein